MRVPIAAVLPDELVGANELLVSRDVGRRIGVVHDRYALLAPHPVPSAAALASELRPIAGGSPIQVRAPGDTPFLRQGDAVLPPIQIKERFGEFDARPAAGSGGFLDIDPAWVRAHIATRHVPLLGEITCNRALFPQLIGAMRELRRRGLGDLVQTQHGCYVPKFVLNSPDGDDLPSRVGDRLRHQPRGQRVRRAASPAAAPGSRAGALGIRVGRHVHRSRRQPLRVPPPAGRRRLREHPRPDRRHGEHFRPPPGRWNAPRSEVVRASRRTLPSTDTPDLRNPMPEPHRRTARFLTLAAALAVAFAVAPQGVADAYVRADVSAPTSLPPPISCRPRPRSVRSPFAPLARLSRAGAEAERPLRLGGRGLAARVPRVRRTVRATFGSALVVMQDTLWMTRSFDAEGTDGRSPAPPLRDPDRHRGRRPGASLRRSSRDSRRRSSRRCSDGQGVLGASSAKLRGIGAGGALQFGGRRVRIAAVLPDEVVGHSELLVSPREGALLGCRPGATAIVQPAANSSRARVAAELGRAVHTPTPLQIRTPRATPVSRAGRSDASSRSHEGRVRGVRRSPRSRERRAVPDRPALAAPPHQVPNPAARREHPVQPRPVSPAPRSASTSLFAGVSAASSTPRTAASSRST